MKEINYLLIYWLGYLFSIGVGLPNQFFLPLPSTSPHQFYLGLKYTLLIDWQWYGQAGKICENTIFCPWIY